MELRVSTLLDAAVSAFAETLGLDEHGLTAATRKELRRVVLLKSETLRDLVEQYGDDEPARPTGGVTWQ